MADSDRNLLPFVRTAPLFPHVWANLLPRRIDIDENTRHFSYLPLPHIFERAVSSGIAGGGGSISFIRSDPNPKIQASFLVDDMVAVKPTVFCCAPRVVNKLKGNVEMAIEDGR